MKLIQTTPIDRETAASIFENGNPDKICDALVRAAHFDPDNQWVEKKCMEFTRNKNDNVKKTAIICLGHLARIHNSLNLKKLFPLLEELKSDPELTGYVEDALDDIHMFIINRADKRNFEI